MAIHPKTGGAAIGGAVGTVIVGILETIPVHIAAALAAGIPALLSSLGAFLAPAKGAQDG